MSDASLVELTILRHERSIACQVLGGHAVMIADMPGLEGRGFEVWRLLHAQYAPGGANYEVDMLQALMTQSPAKDMPALCDAVAKFEYDWRKYEQETQERLTEKFKVSALLKMFPRNVQTEDHTLMDQFTLVSPNHPSIL